jgi:hypothetical protein
MQTEFGATREGEGPALEKLVSMCESLCRRQGLTETVAGFSTAHPHTCRRLMAAGFRPEFRRFGDGKAARIHLRPHGIACPGRLALSQGGVRVQRLCPNEFEDDDDYGRRKKGGRQRTTATTSILPLLHSCPGGVRKSAIHSP